MLTMGRYAPVIACVIFPLIVRGVDSGVFTGDGDELAIDRTACHRLTSTPRSCGGLFPRCAARRGSCMGNKGRCIRTGPFAHPM